MILVTGGLGFIGLHTARSLLDEGQDVVLTQYRVAREPDFIKEDLGKRAFVEQLDVQDADALRAIGERHEITDIIHLAVPGLGALSPADDFRVNMLGLVNILEAGKAWGVRRVAIASSSTVYSGVREVPLREDMPLPMVGSSPTEAFKKSFEILGQHIGGRMELDVIMLRIAGIWGPLYHSMANLPSRVVHAAVSGKPFDPGARGPAYAEDGGDLTYVKDCARGIALLQIAPTLNHRVYNIAAGRPTKNGEIVAAVKKIIPDAEIELEPGQNPRGPGVVTYHDLTRIKTDTGYEPQFTTDAAIADYIGWLQAGNAE
jgi:UDP-glucose 4-epimerase